MTSFTRPWFLVCLCLLAAVVDAEPRRRALLVGINDYGARTNATKAAPLVRRSFPNLRGAVNDVALMEGLLTSVYNFSSDEIVTLTDRAATRDGILTAMDRHLVAGAQSGDTVLFYFSGHGSQVRNSLSEEVDGLDESIVPADVHRGALDIRDKELLRHLAPLVERGA
ncbi:MAG TPA: caspase family protein, partial [Thermoanaerobaculia bacterium]